jgi:hypothetical protein
MQDGPLLAGGETGGMMATRIGSRLRALDGAIRSAAHRLEQSPSDFDPLLDRIGDARVVLLGEATRHDRTRAVEPLERTAQWEGGEAPETWPFGT